MSNKKEQNAEDAERNELWETFFENWQAKERRSRHFFGLIPANPRCKLCNAPFHGVGRPVMRLMGKERSQYNSDLCNACDSFAIANPGGTEVEMAMLFADVRGSTTLAEGMSPRQFSQLIDRFFRATTDVLVRHDAMIDKLVGDEVTAFFFQPFIGQGYARVALDAAQALLRATGHGSPDGPWLPVGVGVNVGRAWFGSVGRAEGMMEVTALGDPVNVAARLASKAGGGEIVVSEETLAAADMASDKLESRLLELKGKSQPMAVRVLRVEDSL